LLVRADEVAALDGFDPALGDRWADVDYCLRAVQRAGGGFVVAPRAWVTHHGRTTGDALADDEGHDQQVFWSRWRGRLPAAEDDSPPDLDHDPLPPPSRAAAGPALRWGLRIASTPGSWGDTWGDTFFARALADALRALGQDVVTHRHGAHDTAVGDLDDVVLVIRGLVPVLPRPGKLNLLWVISHPDEVTDAELQGFDLVLAASEGWAEAARRRTHRPVRTLHQALDLDTLPDSDVPLGPGTVPVFVGSNNPPFRERTAVERAAEAGIGLALHGHGWSGTKAESCVVTDHVPPYDVPTLYRRHGLVLADHWPDMATNGFVANRVFEAVAAGARVVSDPVTGIEDLFGGAVQVYHSVDELRLLCSPAGRDPWPSDAEMGEIAARTREEHSFRRRAEILLEAAVSLRDAR
jgi:hypothetical protein